MLSSNRYQLLEPVSGSTELVFENIQKTDTLRLPGNTINRNRNAFTFQNTKRKRPSIVFNKYPERQINFSRPPIAQGSRLL